MESNPAVEWHRWLLLSLEGGSSPVHNLTVAFDRGAFSMIIKALLAPPRRSPRPCRRPRRPRQRSLQPSGARGHTGWTGPAAGGGDDDDARAVIGRWPTRRTVKC